MPIPANDILAELDLRGKTSRLDHVIDRRSRNTRQRGNVTDAHETRDLIGVTLVRLGFGQMFDMRDFYFVGGGRSVWMGHI